MLDNTHDIQTNIDIVREKMERAAQKRGRRPSDISLLAVTKNTPLSTIQAALRCGLRAFGESRVQEAADKQAALRNSGTPPQDIDWHFIGHLQTNKAKRALDLFDCLQSLDSGRLARQLNRLLEERRQNLRCLVEIKTSDEPSKQGIAPGELAVFLDEAASWPHINIDGLMTIVPYFEDAEKTRPYFKTMKKLFDQHQQRFATDRPVLSMGMSHDFEVAIEEGATLIRVGTSLFGERPQASQP